jgi:hypothetical protein
MEDQDIDGRILLKWIIKLVCGIVDLDLSSSGWGVWFSAVNTVREFRVV